MSKSQHSGRDAKKKPIMTPKQKKIAKQVKKHSHDTQPLIPPVATH